jgi:hypothetical protein
LNEDGKILTDEEKFMIIMIVTSLQVHWLEESSSLAIVCFQKRNKKLWSSLKVLGMKFDKVKGGG